MSVLRSLEREKDIAVELVAKAIEDALLIAYHREEGPDKKARVELNRSTGHVIVWVSETDEEGAVVGEFDGTPTGFGRIATSTAKQVILQRLRDAEDDATLGEYAGREGDIVTGTVQQGDSRYTLLSLGPVEALLPQAEQVPHERPEANTRLKAYIVEVRRTSKGQQIVVSRTHPGLILELFKLEVPEIMQGVVEIRAVAREVGSRTKIAVISKDDSIDPVGACVGLKGSRVQSVVNELGGERIDIVPWSPDPERFARLALAPSRVARVFSDPETRTIQAIVDEEVGVVLGLGIFIRRPGVTARRNVLSEWFFVEDGKIRTIYAAMFYPPPEQPAPNWPPYDGNWPLTLQPPPAAPVPR